jgi:hypothetical protein
MHLIYFLSVLIVVWLSKAKESKCSYSFFFLTYRQPFAARLVFLQLRSIYPSSPIYIVTDNGGYDLSSFCQGLGPSLCQSHVLQQHMGHAWQSSHAPLSSSTLGKMKLYFGHMATAAEWADCEYLVYVEEDVWLRRAFKDSEQPAAETGGIYNKNLYPTFTRQLQSYIGNRTGQAAANRASLADEDKRRFENRGAYGHGYSAALFGAQTEALPYVAKEVAVFNTPPTPRPLTQFHMAVPTVIYAGSYYRSRALVRAVREVMPTIDWLTVSQLDPRVPKAWDTVPPVLMPLAGYKAAYWHAVCEKNHAQKKHFGTTCEKAVLLHKHSNTAFLAYLRDAGSKLVEEEVRSGALRIARDLNSSTDVAKHLLRIRKATGTCRTKQGTELCDV